MKILVCGSRNMPESLLSLVEEHVRRLGATTVISGMARGADTLAVIAAQRSGLPVLKFPANWKLYGKSAGFIRNQQMLDEGKPDHVLAFAPESGITNGTADMVRRTQKAGVPYEVVSYKEIL